MSRAFTCVG